MESHNHMMVTKETLATITLILYCSRLFIRAIGLSNAHRKAMMAYTPARLYLKAGCIIMKITFLICKNVMYVHMLFCFVEAIID